VARRFPDVSQKTKLGPASVSLGNRRNLLKLLETPALFSGMKPSGVRVVSGLLITNVRFVREMVVRHT
jgi:hypothetical protein